MRTREVVGNFMADAKLRGLSARTLEGYACHLGRLTELSHDYPPKPDIIQTFLANVKGGPHNADAHYRTFRALSRWAQKRYKTKNFMKSVTRPRVPKQIMPTISEMQLSLLAAWVAEAPLRDKAIIMLFVDTAIRSGEACNLKREDIHEDRIVIHGKTGYRVAPISPSTREVVLSLPAYPDGYVFHGEDSHVNQPLKKTGFYKVVRRYLRLVGHTGKQFGPQILRRSFGVFHLKDGGDLKSLSMILGHSNITTTANYYTPLLTEDVIEIHHKHTPIKVFQEVNAD